MVQLCCWKPRPSIQIRKRTLIIENVAPGEPGHEWWRFGASDEISAFGVEKFRTQVVKQKIDEKYQDSVIPGKYNCMKVNVTPDLVAGLKEFQAKLENTNVKDLGSKLPAETAGKFIASQYCLNNIPKMQQPKEIIEPIKPKYYGLKKIFFVNIFFKKELNDYKVASKEYKIQSTVRKAFTTANQNTVEQPKDQPLNQNLQQNAQNIGTEIKRTSLDSTDLKASIQKDSHHDAHIL